VTRATMPASAPRRRRRPAFDSTRASFTRTGPSRCSLAQGPVEECGHLAPGHVVVRAEPVVLRRVAPTGNTCRRQTVEVCLEDMPVVVDELVPAAVLRIAHRSRQERLRLTP